VRASPSIEVAAPHPVAPPVRFNRLGDTGSIRRQWYEPVQFSLARGPNTVKGLTPRGREAGTPIQKLKSASPSDDLVGTQEEFAKSAGLS
jgi:hypothetical protein